MHKNLYTLKRVAAVLFKDCKTRKQIFQKQNIPNVYRKPTCLKSYETYTFPLRVCSHSQWFWVLLLQYCTGITTCLSISLYLALSLSGESEVSALNSLPQSIQVTVCLFSSLSRNNGARRDEIDILSHIL